MPLKCRFGLRNLRVERLDGFPLAEVGCLGGDRCCGCCDPITGRILDRPPAGQASHQGGDEAVSSPYAAANLDLRWPDLDAATMRSDDGPALADGHDRGFGETAIDQLGCEQMRGGISVPSEQLLRLEMIEADEIRLLLGGGTQRVAVRVDQEAAAEVSCLAGEPRVEVVRNTRRQAAARHDVSRVALDELAQVL